MLIPSDQVFLTLYRELYFRHVYAKLQPTIDDRFQSYENICELFNYLLSKYHFIHFLLTLAFRRTRHLAPRTNRAGQP